MQPAQTFGRRGAVAPAPTPSPQPRHAVSQPQPSRETSNRERVEHELAARARSIAPVSDRGMLWVLFGFEGRIGPGNFRLVRFASHVIFLAALWAILSLTKQILSSKEIGSALLLLLFDLATLCAWFWTTAAIQIKRWHDRDKSGVWMFVGFIPFIGPLWTLVELWFLEGTVGPNRFGPSPKGDPAAVTAAVFEA